VAEHDVELRQGAKAAAAAAAVGAAVGVARAIASRAEDAAHRDGRDDEGAERGRPEQRAEQDDRRGQDAQEEQEEQEERSPEGEQPAERNGHEPVRGTSVDRLRRLAEHAREVLHELSGAEVESVSGVDRTPDGWRITLEAVEVHRIPESTDVLASYVVELDDGGDLVRYERGRRYSRAQSDRGDER
jgi:hypothetical protein